MRKAGFDLPGARGRLNNRQQKLAVVDLVGGARIGAGKQGIQCVRISRFGKQKLAKPAPQGRLLAVSL